MACGCCLRSGTRLARERTNAQGSDDERRRAKAEIDGRLALLNERIVTARPVEHGTEAPTDVRFGVMVTVAYRGGPQQGTERTFTIVGVDEASVAEQRFAFTAPIARALMGKRVGDIVKVTLGASQQELEVQAISWPTANSPGET